MDRPQNLIEFTFTLIKGSKEKEKCYFSTFFVGVDGVPPKALLSIDWSDRGFG